MAKALVRRRVAQDRTLGLTLIELIIVLAVVGILLGFAASGFEQMRAENNLRSSQNAVAQFLRRAREQADASGTRVVVSVAPSVLTMTGTDGLAQSLDLPRGVVASSTRSGSYSFMPGKTASTGTIRLNASTAGTVSRAIVVSGYGRIQTGF